MEGIDTDILVYAFDESSPFHNQARKFIEDKIQKTVVAISEFSLLEFYGLITDGRKVKSPFTSQEASDIINDFYDSQCFSVLSCSEACVKQLLDNTSIHNVKLNDIYNFFIAKTFEGNGVKKLYTANLKNFKKFNFIQSVNPFKISERRDQGKKTQYPSSTFSLIPYGKQSITEKDVAEVCSVLRSDYITQGTKIPEFEQAVSEYVGAKYGVAVANGTSALHCAMYALGIGSGDEVIVPPITFAATANAVCYTRATPVFVDVEKDTLLINPDALEAAITKKTRAIIGVDYAGHPCNWDSLRNIADRHGLALVADSCHALGAEYHGRKVGTLADMTVFSFHPVKHITTGEGGMVVTDRPEFAEKVRMFRSHGITTDARQREKSGAWFYEMVDLGYNYRITDIQCALGISQLRKQSNWLNQRKGIARKYDAFFKKNCLARPLAVYPDVNHAYHLYVVRVVDREAIFSELRRNGIGVNVHYIPVHLHPYYRNRFGYGKGLCPVSEMAADQIISIPMFPELNDDEVLTVMHSFNSLKKKFQFH